MTKGVYYSGSDSVLCSGIYSDNYMGEYELQTKLDGKIIDRFSLDSKVDLWSNFDIFNILVDDYNDDGKSDFTVGYWGGSNGMVYWIFGGRKRKDLSSPERWRRPDLLCSMS